MTDPAAKAAEAEVLALTVDWLVERYPERYARRTAQAPVGRTCVVTVAPLRLQIRVHQECGRQPADRHHPDPWLPAQLCGAHSRCRNFAILAT